MQVGKETSGERTRLPGFGVSQRSAGWRGGLCLCEQPAGKFHLRLSASPCGSPLPPSCARLPTARTRAPRVPLGGRPRIPVLTVRGSGSRRALCSYLRGRRAGRRPAAGRIRLLSDRAGEEWRGAQGCGGLVGGRLGTWAAPRAAPPQPGCARSLQVWAPAEGAWRGRRRSVPLAKVPFIRAAGGGDRQSGRRTSEGRGAGRMRGPSPRARSARGARELQAWAGFAAILLPRRLAAAHHFPRRKEGGVPWGRFQFQLSQTGWKQAMGRLRGSLRIMFPEGAAVRPTERRVEGACVPRL